MSGPVMAWLLLPSVLGGGAEWIAHLVQLGMLALAIFATVALALRLGAEPLPATASGLLLAAAPAVLGMAGTAMPDLPAMSLGVAGLERLVAWKQERHFHQALLAAILLALAPLARSHLILVLGIGALLLLRVEDLQFSGWRSARWTVWIPLAAAPALTLFLVLLTRDASASSGTVVTAPGQLMSLSQLAPNAVAFTTHWVLMLPLGIPWLFLRFRPLVVRWWVPTVAAIAAAVVLILYNQQQFLPYAIVAGLGVAVLWDVIADALTRNDHVQLALGLWMLVPLAPAPYTHLPPKYLLASAPAAAILVARAMNARRGIVPRLVFGATLLAGAGLGIAILRADEVFAGLGRRAAVELIQPQIAAGRNVWFVGHWGFQWYAEQMGARCVTFTPPYPAKGDLVVQSLNTDHRPLLDFALSKAYPSRIFLGRVGATAPGGRIMDRDLGAGFYSNRLGYLPWAWASGGVLDEFQLWEIE